MIKDKKIIITGGLGFIGSHLAGSLSTYNDVTIIDDCSSGSMRNIRHLKADRISVIHGNVAELDMKRTFKRCDYVFHEAAIASVPGSIRDPIGNNNANVDGTLKVLDAARDAGAQKVVFASSSAIYGDAETGPIAETAPVRPRSPYAVTKAASEMYCAVYSEIYGLPTIALRYFNVFGPRQDPNSQYSAVIPKFITTMLSGKSPVIYGDGEQSRDFTYVKHVVDANLLACEHGLSGTYNVASGRSISLNQLVDMINEIMGTDIKPVYADARPGDIKYSAADIHKAHVFRFEPRCDFKAELRETIEWFGRDMQKANLSLKSQPIAMESMAR